MTSRAFGLHLNSGIKTGNNHLISASGTDKMLDIRPLSEELQRIAIEELGEVPSRIPEDLKALKDWLATQPHLNARTDDQFLIQFLRCCKYNMGKAKELLDLYFSLKTKHPEMFNATNVDDPKFRKVSKLGAFMTLPVPLYGNGPRIIVYKFNYPTDIYSMDEVMQAFIAMHEIIIMNDPYACIHGIIYVVDCGPATYTHYQQLADISRKLMSFLESVPLRIKSINYINTIGAPQELFSVPISSFSEDMRKRVYIAQDNMDEILQNVPLKYLPRDFMGEQPSLLELSQDYDQVWNANREFLKDNILYGTNELLRRNKPFDLDSLFAANGSFKKDLR